MRSARASFGLARSCAIGQIHPVTPAATIELAVLRRMTAGQKIAVMNALWRQAWALKVAGVRWLHPEWPDQQVAAEVRRLFAK